MQFIHLVLACIGHIILLIFYALYKVTTMKNQIVKPYAFRIFKYEEIKPSRSSVVPLPRSGHRIVCDTKNLYSFGGYNPLILNDADDTTRNIDDYSVHSYPLFQELWKFNLASKTWNRYTSRPSLPQELASNAVIREGHYLMVYDYVRDSNKHAKS